MSGLMRAKNVQADDVLDRIFKAWLAHKLEDMPLQEIWLLERMEYADALIREGGARSIYKNMVEDMRQKFKHMEVTRRTIENDIARAKRFFLSARPRDEKEYARGKYIEWGEKMMWEAHEGGDSKAAAAFFKELGTIQEFKKEDIERPEYESVQPPPMMIIMDPAAIGVPVIDNLEEEIRILTKPKGVNRNTDNIDEADQADGSE